MIPMKTFMKNFHINVPENFNFGFDVVDVLAAEKPEAARARLVQQQRGKPYVYVL